MSHACRQPRKRADSCSPEGHRRFAAWLRRPRHAAAEATDFPALSRTLPPAARPAVPEARLNSVPTMVPLLPARGVRPNADDQARNEIATTSTYGISARAILVRYLPTRTRTFVQVRMMPSLYGPGLIHIQGLGPGFLRRWRRGPSIGFVRSYVAGEVAVALMPAATLGAEHRTALRGTHESVLPTKPVESRSCSQTRETDLYPCLRQGETRNVPRETPLTPSL
jgi:hypothetical protein